MTLVQLSIAMLILDTLGAQLWLPAVVRHSMMIVIKQGIKQAKKTDKDFFYLHVKQHCCSSQILSSWGTNTHKFRATIIISNSHHLKATIWNISPLLVLRVIICLVHTDRRTSL